MESNCEYLIFQMAIAFHLRKDFVAQHVQNKEMGYFYLEVILNCHLLPHKNNNRNDLYKQLFQSKMAFKQWITFKF